MVSGSRADWKMGRRIRSCAWCANVYTTKSIHTKCRWYGTRRLLILECVCAARSKYHWVCVNVNNQMTIRHSINVENQIKMDKNQILFIVRGKTVWFASNCVHSWRWIHVRIKPSENVQSWLFSWSWRHFSHNKLPGWSARIFKHRRCKLPRKFWFERSSDGTQMDSTEY